MIAAPSHGREGGRRGWLGQDKARPVASSACRCGGSRLEPGRAGPLPPGEGFGAHKDASPPIALNGKPPLVVEGAPILNRIAGDPTARQKDRGSIGAPRESLRRLRCEKLPFGQAVGVHNKRRAPLLPAADKAFWPSAATAAEHPPDAEERNPDGDRQAARRKKSVDDGATNHSHILSTTPPPFKWSCLHLRKLSAPSAHQPGRGAHQPSKAVGSGRSGRMAAGRPEKNRTHQTQEGAGRSPLPRVIPIVGRPPPATIIAAVRPPVAFASCWQASSGGPSSRRSQRWQASSPKWRAPARSRAFLRRE